MQNQLFYAYFTAIEITTILLHTMIGLLTTKELDFLTKLAELLKEYSAIISYGHCSELRILVCAGDSEDVEKYPIIFEDSFDENEIYDLLRKNRKRIEEIIECEVAEAVPEGELSQPDDQAGSMADHFH